MEKKEDKKLKTKMFMDKLKIYICKYC